MAGSEECSGYIGAICCRRRRKRSNSACSRSRSCPAARERHRDHTHTYRYAREHRRARSRGRGFDAVVREGRGEGTRGREQASRLDRQGGSRGSGEGLACQPASGSRVWWLTCRSHGQLYTVHHFVEALQLALWPSSYAVLAADLLEDGGAHAEDPWRAKRARTRRAHSGTGPTIRASE